MRRHNSSFGRIYSTSGLFSIIAAGLLMVSVCGCRSGNGKVEETEHALTREKISAGFDEQRSLVDSCVARAESRIPDLSGTVVVSGIIDPQGRVQDASIDSSDIQDRLLNDCIVRATRGARFESIGQVTPFRYPWTLGARAQRPSVSADDTGWAAAQEPYGGGGEGFVDDHDEDTDLPAFDQPSINSLVQENMGSFNACYEAELDDSPDLAGTVNITWAVAPNGSVLSAVVTGDIVDGTNLPECIGGIIRSLRFAPSDASSPMQASFAIDFKQSVQPVEED